MAIDTTQVGDFEYPGEEGEEVGNPPSSPQTWRRSDWLRPNALWAIVGGVVGYLIGHWLGNVIASGYTQVQDTGQNDVAIVLGLSLGVAGFMAGVGALNYPLAKILGYELSPHPPEPTWARYFRMTDDHKVVGMQYAVGVLLFLFTGGLLAMLIRTELLSPTSHVFGPGTYIAIVGEHGTIMMMMASSAVVGPLGNWLIPLMIGSRRMAYPRVEAFSFWIFMAGYLVIVSALFFGGFPTGWTGYAPLQTQAGGGMDSYLVGFAVIGIGMILAGFNLACTIINYRAPGMTWSRLPIFAWADPGDHRAAHAGHADAGGRGPDGDPRPHRRDRVLRQRARRQQLPVAEPLLVLRPSRGLHHGPAGFRDRHGDHAGLHPQAPLRLQGGGSGHAGGGAPVLLRMAAPPLPERDQSGHAAALHADDRAHLHPDGVPLPRHARARSGRRRSGSTPRCSSASGCCSIS